MAGELDEWLVPDKVYQYLLHLVDTPDTRKQWEYLKHSRLYKEPRKYLGTDAFNLYLIVDPEIYKKYQDEIDDLHEDIQERYMKFTGEEVIEVHVRPELSKFRVLKNDYKPAITPWEEINQGQQQLIEQLRTAKNDIDFQNIGNASRVLLQRLSNIVFDPEVHKSTKEGIDLREGKFKNRLHTFIKHELSEKKYEHLSEYAIAVIDTAETCVDLANKLTHDLNADSMLAESCVIGTITTINIIKLVGRQ